jgi:hypothetical protein
MMFVAKICVCVHVAKPANEHRNVKVLVKVSIARGITLQVEQATALQMVCWR